MLDEILALSDSGFGGIFHVVYDGGFDIRIETAVNLNVCSNSTQKDGKFWGMNTLSAHIPYITPVSLSVSNLKLDGRIVLEYSKEKGISYSFHNDPFKSIDISVDFVYFEFVKKIINDHLESTIKSFISNSLVLKKE